MHSKIEIVSELQRQLKQIRGEHQQKIEKLLATLNKETLYANRYKELRSIGVLVVEEGTDPKYLKGEDMDAFFEGIGVYRGATPMTKLLAEKMIQTKNVLAAKILEKLYDEHTRS